MAISQIRKSDFDAWLPELPEAEIVPLAFTFGVILTPDNKMVFPGLINMRLKRNQPIG